MGNPGRDYEETRHNLGRLVLTRTFISEKVVWKKKFKGFFGESTFAGRRVRLLLPETYMNLSGESVGEMCKFYKVEAENLLILHDELDISFGQIMFKKGGGIAGHNGLSSIVNHLSSNKFDRLRLGISRPDRMSVSSWVLSKFSNDEMIVLQALLDEAAKAIEYYICNGINKASQQYNKKNLI